MNLLQSFTGMVEAEITSGDIGRTLCIASEYGIVLYKVEIYQALTASFAVSRSDFRKLAWLCRQRGDTLKVRKRSGLYWKVRHFFQRPILAAGLGLTVLLFLVLPARILFVQVEGNLRIPAEKILETASDSGIHFGVSRRQVRSEATKNELLRRMPELSWAGVNTRGCTAIVTVQERKGEKHRQETIGVAGVYASRDGIITACTATEGTLLCKPGQAVTKGQLLISGYTDCVGSIRAAEAEGEIFAETDRNFTVSAPLARILRRDKTGTSCRWSLLIGKKRINFPWNSGIPDSSCGRMYEEYYITLPGGYVLPAAVAMDVYTVYNTEASAWKPERLQKRLAAFAEDYLQQHMIAGKILHGRPSYCVENNVLHLQGQYLCHEMIGRSRQEKIGE